MEITEKEIKQLIKEELSKQEVRDMINSRLAAYLKDRDFKKEVRDVAVEVLDNFFREMWNKRGFWKTPLKNG